MTASQDPRQQPVRVLRQSRAAPADAVRPTRAEINLGCIRHNLRAIERISRSPVWAVLKADAYGHGAKPVARALERAGIAGLCVALIEEAIELRDAGISVPILVMGADYRGAWELVLHHGLTPVLHEAGQIEELAKEISYRGVAPYRVHLKLDTGMSRLGIGPRELARVVDSLARQRQIELDGLMTHFASADRDRHSIGEQLRLFWQEVADFERARLKPRVLHAANSAALLAEPEAHLDLVRPGLLLMGELPGAPSGLAAEPAIELKPAMQIRSAIFSLRELAAGEHVGYGATWTAQRPSRIATIPMGYADGLSHQASNNGCVLVRGKRAPIVGSVSMDLTTLDVTEIEGVALADEVIVLGEQTGPLGQDRIRASEIAARQGTISWEVLTNISRRVPRFYREP